MKTRVSFFLLAVALLASPWRALGAAAKSTSDLMPPTRRQQTVDTAERLTRPPLTTPIPAELPQPFNPPGFDLPEATESQAGATAGPRPGTGPTSGQTAAVAQPQGPTGNREILETLATRLPPAGGTLKFGGETLLLIGGKRLKVGSIFSVADPKDGREYEFELTSIDQTTFTLRYHKEEITIPTKPQR